MLYEELTDHVVNETMERAGFLGVPADITKDAVVQFLGHNSVSSDLTARFASFARAEHPEYDGMAPFNIIGVVAHEAADLMWGGLEGAL